ncbi:MAG: 5-(carboxyamino)imidazole ribonucleotide mutase [Selenomonadaceae bacterium]|nr:5-(carboxyamino)imidazole ribonucleotide mutase [Selenomonadaceae bacterium]
MDVAIIMGSDSDWGVVKSAVEFLKDFGVEVEATVASAHRTPNKVQEFVKNCDAQDVKVFIAAAGCAAHLAGVVASYTVKPVIGIPINSEPLKGMDALLSTVQMPSGIPVATMAINGAKNAAIFAAQILALSNDDIKKKLEDYRADMAKEVEKKAENIKTALSATTIGFKCQSECNL